MDNILIISDFPDVQYKKDSGTPALRLIVEALSKKYNIHIIAPSGEAQSNGNIFYHRIPDTQFINGSSRLSNIINKKIFWFTFTRKAHEISITLNKQYDFKLVYGAGCNSVYAASYIGRYFDIPSVGRLFGTYLYPYLNNPIALALRFEEVLAFKSPCTKFIITNDGTGGDEVAEHFDIPKERLHFWMNGVDRPPLLSKIFDNKIRIISMARLEGWKHVNRIITAFYLASLQNKDIVLEIVGGGPEEENLKKMVNDFGIKDRVTFYGEVSRTEALQVLGLSDIFISTNDYSNVSNSLMEAMSGGKGIIVCNTGKTSMMINNKNGLLVQNKCELSDAILQMCNKEMRAFFGYKAKLYAADHFESWESRINKEVTACSELIYTHSVYRLIPDDLKRRIR